MAKTIFIWDKKLNTENQIQSWYSEVGTIFSQNEMQDIFESGNLFSLKQVIEKLHSSMLKRQQILSKTECQNSSKLRTFVKFKDFSNTPNYLTKPLTFIQRKFLAKIRLGCLEIRVETGRYARPRLPAESRLCQVCENNDQKVEDEFHFIFECNKYDQERSFWLNKLKVPDNFITETQEKKLDLVLNDHSNVKLTAQFIINIFDIRSKIVNNLPNANSTNAIFHLSPQDQCPACAHLYYNNQ